MSDHQDIDRDKVRSRAAKLLALARRGVGGEKETAQRFLDRLLQKHGITLADLDDEHEQPQLAEFPFKDVRERQLLVQIICTVCGVERISTWRARGKVITAVTRAQRIEVYLSAAALLPAWRKTVERAWLAFIHTNDLSGKRKDDDEEQPPSKLSAEDLEAIMGMMSGMQKTPVRRAIEHRGAA